MIIKLYFIECLIRFEYCAKHFAYVITPQFLRAIYAQGFTDEELGLREVKEHAHFCHIMNK